jgi:predicted GNAT family acetyltransferase
MTVAHRADAPVVIFNVGTSVTFTKPVGLAVGDIMVARLWVFENDFTSSTAGTTAASSGWNPELRTDWAGGGPANSSTQFILSKVATSGDVAASNFTFNFTLISGGTAHSVTCWCDLSAWIPGDTTTPISVTEVSANTGTGTAAAGTSVTSTRGGVALAFTSSSTGARSSGVPATWSAMGYSPYDGNVYTEFKTVAASGSTGTASSTYGTSQNWLVQIIVIQEAGGGGGTDTPMTIDVTQTQTIVRLRGVGLIKSITNSQTLVRLRAILRTLTATETQTPSMTKGQGFLKLLSAVVTQTMVRLRSVGQVRSATETQTTGTTPTKAVTETFTQTLTRQRALAPIAKNVIETQTPTRLRALSPIAKSAIETQTPSMAKGQGYLKTATATAVQTVVYIRALGLVRSATSAQTLFTARALVRTLVAIQAQTAVANRALAKGLLVTDSQAATMFRSAVRLLSLTTTQTPTYSRAAAKVLSALSTQTLDRTRALARALNVNEAQTPSVDAQQSGGGSQSMTLTADAIQTVSLVRAIARSLLTTETQTAIRERALALPNRSTTNTQTPSMVKGQGFFKTLTAITTQTLVAIRNVGASKSSTSSQTPSIGPRQFAVARSINDVQTASAAKSFANTRSSTETQTPSLVKGQGYFKTITANAVQTALSLVRNVGKLLLRTQPQTSSIGRTFTMERNAVATQTAVRQRAIDRYIAIVSAQQASSQAAGGASQFMTVLGDQVQTAYLSRHLGFRLLPALQTQLPSMTYVVVGGGGLVTSITLDPNSLPARATIRIILP